MLTENTLTRIRRCLAEVSAKSNVYIGCDSSRKQDDQGLWSATYHTAVVVHVDNSKGCRVFVDSETMPDFDHRADRPTMRMMNESLKAVEAYQQLEAELADRYVELHLDVNKDPLYGSNAARAMVEGYAIGATGRVVRVKPDAFAASYAADRAVRGKIREPLAA